MPPKAFNASWMLVTAEKVGAVPNVEAAVAAAAADWGFCCPWVIAVGVTPLTVWRTRPWRLTADEVAVPEIRTSMIRSTEVAPAVRATSTLVVDGV